METNKEGMTFPEWYQAANAFGYVIGVMAAMKAWEKGEDPSEYAANSTPIVNYSRGYRESRQYREGEEVEVGDVVHLFDGAFSSGIVVKLDGGMERLIHIERPMMMVQGIVGDYTSVCTSYERFTTYRSKLRVYVTGSGGEKDNRFRKPKEYEAP